MKTQEQYAGEYAELSNDDLISEFEINSWAADRTVGEQEGIDSVNSLNALRAELLKRMK